MHSQDWTPAVGHFFQLIPRTADICVTGISICCSPSRSSATMRGTFYYPGRLVLCAHHHHHHHTLQLCTHFLTQDFLLLQERDVQLEFRVSGTISSPGIKMGIATTLSKIRFRYTSCTASMTSFHEQSSHSKTSNKKVVHAENDGQNPRATHLFLVLLSPSAPLFISHNLSRLNSLLLQVSCAAPPPRFHSSWLEQCQRVSLFPQRVLSPFTTHHSSRRSNRVILDLTSPVTLLFS